MDRYLMSKLIKLNVKAWVERLLINNGLYINVASGDLDVNGNQIGVLHRNNGNVYESRFNRWIYETDASGVAPYNTTVPSGVYVNGTFYSRGSSPYQPVIDFDNGRVLFGSPVPLSSTVTSAFSYKEVTVDFPDSNAVRLLFVESKNNDDFDPFVFPSGNQTTVPLVVIDLQKRTEVPFSLGGGNEFSQRIVFHILANSDDEVDLIADILTEKSQNKVFWAVNYNNTPELLTYQGDVSNTYESFNDLQNDVTLRWSRIYVDEAFIQSTDKFQGYCRGRVDWGVSVFR